MTIAPKYRYPSAPSDASDEEKSVWNTLVRILEKRDHDNLFGDPKSIPINQLKDGVFMKGFTTVSSSNYYAKPEDGTLLALSSLSGCTIHLVSANSSNYSVVCVKKIDGNGATHPVIIQDAGGASIDGGAAVTVSSTNGSVILACDGKQWWILSKNL